MSRGTLCGPGREGEVGGDRFMTPYKTSHVPPYVLLSAPPQSRQRDNGVRSNEAILTVCCELAGAYNVACFSPHIPTTSTRAQWQLRAHYKN